MMEEQLAKEKRYDKRFAKIKKEMDNKLEKLQK